LALAFERGEIRILNDVVLVSELAAYQAERLPSGLLRYSAPAGQHDDCVMALAIAWSAASSQHRAVYPVLESELVMPPFTIPAHWPRAYGLELGHGSAAANSLTSTTSLRMRMSPRSKARAKASTACALLALVVVNG